MNFGTADRRERIFLIVSTLLFVLTPLIGYALTIAQTDASASAYGGLSNAAQALGFGLQGTFQSLEIKYHCFNYWYTVGILTYRSREEWKAGYVNYVDRADSTIWKRGGWGGCDYDSTDVWVASDFPKPIVFDPSKFYVI